MNSYKDLLVWQKGIELVKEVYYLTQQYPSDEKFCLVNQMRRAVISIVSNIAEGYARRGRKENAQFVNIAFGSAIEIETQLIISKQLNYLTSAQCLKVDKLLDEILRMLYRYRESLQQ